MEKNRLLKIGIVGDLEKNHPSRIATDASLNHAAAALSATADISWMPTRVVEQLGADSSLESFDALWCAPGSPYESTDGALDAIRFARQRDRPFVAT